jgi:hypothetical protein
MADRWYLWFHGSIWVKRDLNIARLWDEHVMKAENA